VSPGPSILAAPKAAHIWGFQPTNHLFEWMSMVGDTHGKDMYLFLYKISVPFSELWRYKFQCKEALLGALSLKYESAGKIRVFAMVDYWTQHVLLPLHKHLFKLLKTFSVCDSTFDQEGSVKSFTELGCNAYYSFDLKSATDMISIDYYIDMLDSIFEKPIGRMWANLLVDRDFHLPKKGKSERYEQDGKTYIRYTRGQPMGALSSWASLALLHHFIVQYSAFQVYGTYDLFFKYRVLGDDVVIGTTEVAEQYIKTCKELSIPISLAKSIISPPTPLTGKKGERLFQFANQIVLGPENISPCSLREEISANTCAARLELVSRLLVRDWKRPYLNTVSFYLKALAPRKWYTSAHAMSKGKIPLFMRALLPILLSPAVKDCGITGLSKLLVWYRTLRLQYNYADLLNHKFWDLSSRPDERKAFIRFMSDRAMNLYADIMSSQSLNQWNKEYKEAKRFGSESLQTMIHTYLPLVSEFIRDNEGPKVQGFIGPCDIRGSMEFQKAHKALLEPLYTFSEPDPKDPTKNIDVTFDVNMINVPLVCAAREQYLDRLGKEVRPLLTFSPHTKRSWMLDIGTTIDLVLGSKHNVSWIVDINKDTLPDAIRLVSETPMVKQLDIPLWLPIFAGKAFCLSTKDEFYTFGKVTSREAEWDCKKPLVCEQGDPVTIPATFARLERLASFIRLAAQLNPAVLFKRSYDTNKPSLQKDSPNLSRDIRRHIKEFRKYDSSFYSLLFYEREHSSSFPSL
jgi:hypothetical protein